MINENTSDCEHITSQTVQGEIAWTTSSEASETTKGFDPLKGLAVIAYFER